MNTSSLHRGEGLSRLSRGADRHRGLDLEQLEQGESKRGQEVQDHSFTLWGVGCCALSVMTVLAWLVLCWPRLSLSLSIHTRTHARTHARMHTHIHANITYVKNPAVHVGGLSKNKNNLACTESVTAFRVLKLDTVRKKKNTDRGNVTSAGTPVSSGLFVSGDMACRGVAAAAAA